MGRERSAQCALYDLDAHVERFARDGVEAVGNSKVDFAAFLKAEMVKWGRVVKERNIKVE